MTRRADRNALWACRLTGDRGGGARPTSARLSPRIPSATRRAVTPSLRRILRLLSCQGRSPAWVGREGRCRSWCDQDWLGAGSTAASTRDSPHRRQNRRCGTFPSPHWPQIRSPGSIVRRAGDGRRTGAGRASGAAGGRAAGCWEEPAASSSTKGRVGRRNGAIGVVGGRSGELGFSAPRGNGVATMALARRVRSAVIELDAAGSGDTEGVSDGAGGGLKGDGSVAGWAGAVTAGGCSDTGAGGSVEGGLDDRSGRGGGMDCGGA